MKYHVSGLSQDVSMIHPLIEGTHDHGITYVHPVNQSTARDNVLIQPHTSNEGHGERQDITATNKTSKQRPHDSEASPVKQGWDSPILIDDKHDPAPCRTHHGRGLDITHVSFSSSIPFETLETNGTCNGFEC